jgi:cytochrome c oxidase subunit 2
MNTLRRLILGTALLSALVGPGAASPSPRQDDPPAAGSAPRVIEVHAKRFEFEPKEIHLAMGEDVTHGFFSRPLHFDEDLVPGKTVSIPLAPKEPGQYTVICDHYCGSGHGGMKMIIVVE